MAKARIPSPPLIEIACLGAMAIQGFENRDGIRK